MRTEKEIKERMLELESKYLFNDEDKGEWKALVWILDGKREKPWNEEEMFNEFGQGR